MRAVDGVDLTVHRGEVFGVLGPNGAGKTTILKMLATLLPIDAGEAKIFGTDVAQRPARRPAADGRHRPVRLGRREPDRHREPGALRPAAGARPGEGTPDGAELLEQFGLEEAADKPISQFSGGMRRRLDLAASLITRPPLIFLDEPTTGLDPRTRGQMWDTIRELVARRLHGAADHAVPRRGRPARRPDRGDRPRREGRRGHLRRAEVLGRPLHPAAAARRPATTSPSRPGRGVGARRAAGADPGGPADEHRPAAQRPGRRRTDRAARAAHRDRVDDRAEALPRRGLPRPHRSRHQRARPHGDPTDPDDVDRPPRTWRQSDDHHDPPAPPTSPPTRPQGSRTTSAWPTRSARR